MKCPNCGAIVGDGDMFCTMCGFALAGDTNRQMNQQQTQGSMTQYMYQPDMGTPEQYIYQPNMGNSEQYTYQSNMGTSEQYMYQPNMGGPATKKKMSKKSIIIALSVIAVLAIAVVVYLFPLGGMKKLTERKNKREITNSAEDYLDAVEDFDLEKILQMTIPKSLLKELINDAIPLIALYDSYYLEELEDYTGSSVDEIMKNFDEYYDMAISLGTVAIDQYNKECDISVKFDNPKITSVKAISINDIIDPFYGMIDGEDAGYLDKENVIELIDTFADNYGLDFDNMYAVYVKTGIKLSGEGETISYSADEVCKAIEETTSSLEEDLGVDFEFTDSKDGVRAFFAYEYDGEYYLLPDPEAVVLPALIRYIDKSRMSSDISSAQQIKTTIETVMGREDIYCYFTEENAGKYFEVTESGFEKMDSYVAEEIHNYLGDSYPEVKYTEGGQRYFTFMVDEDGMVKVYISDGSTPDTWQIQPELDDDYH